MHERGIIKWLPFNSLNNDNMNYSKAEIVPKPLLLEDEINIINDILKEIIETKTQVKIKYYYNQNIYFIIGSVTDFKKDYIKISNKIIYLSQILDIKII